LAVYYILLYIMMIQGLLMIIQGLFGSLFDSILMYVMMIQGLSGCIIYRYTIISYHIMSYHNVVFKWQNHLKVGTVKPKLNVRMQSAVCYCV